MMMRRAERERRRDDHGNFTGNPGSGLAREGLHRKIVGSGRQVRTVLLDRPDRENRQRVARGGAQLLPVHFSKQLHTRILLTASQSRLTPRPGPSGGVRNPSAIEMGVATMSRQYRKGPNVSQAYGKRGTATARWAQAAVPMP